MIDAPPLRLLRGGLDGKPKRVGRCEVRWCRDGVWHLSGEFPDAGDAALDALRVLGDLGWPNNDGASHRRVLVRDVVTGEHVRSWSW